MNSLSSHVLDTTLGKPASGMQLTLTAPNGELINAVTNSDGRCNDWGGTELPAGTYCLRFHCHEYLVLHHGKSFYPFIDIQFAIEENGGHYHVPVLDTPFGYSTYRGS